MTQDREKWDAVVNTEMTHQVPYNAENTWLSEFLKDSSSLC
jgi:hypothetical protein